MKVVMYHYVRPAPPGLPHFRYLHVEDFRRQLDWLQANHRMLGIDELLAAVAEGVAPDGAVLTFDDAFSDHHDHVWPELAARGLAGIFYVATGIYGTGKLLDVHRIHLLLGKLGGGAASELLRSILTDDMLSHDTVAEFHAAPYRLQDNDEGTAFFKRSLNYFISYDHREAVLDRLMALAMDGEDERALAGRFYLRPEQIRAMRAGGMLIGAHGVRHLVMSKLPEAEQRREIRDSCAFLADLLDEPVRSFCYPYGSRASFTAETERLLAEEGCRFTFSTESRAVTDDDLRRHPHALPRLDCNTFPHGRARVG